MVGFRKAELLSWDCFIEVSGAEVSVFGKRGEGREACVGAFCVTLLQMGKRCRCGWNGVASCS